MVQKRKPPAAAKPVAPATEPKRRGRPRAYEPEQALGKALDLFRKDGFAATSLDDLSAATGMNRPSLYGAFGDKRELYIKSYMRYREDSRAAMADIFKTQAPIRERLARLFAVALDIYLSGEAGPRGCFTVMLSHFVSAPPSRTASCRRRPIQKSWRIWRRRPFIPSPSAPGRGCRARNSRRSCGARSM
jgi:AcrR family transcriptional regulator